MCLPLVRPNRTSPSLTRGILTRHRSGFIFFSIFSFFFPSFWFTSLADWHRLALGDIRRYAVELFFVGRCYLDQRKRVSFSFFLSVGWLVALSEAIGMNVLRHGEYVDTRAFSAKKGTTF